MSMLSLRRRAMSDNKILPYDAEIKYLQSTGTQWIDTLINQKETQRYLSVEVNVQVPVLESGEHDIAGSGSGNTPTMGYSGSNYFAWANGGTSWYPKSSDTNWHNNIYTFFTSSGRIFSEDGVIYRNDYVNKFAEGAYNTLFLFASSPDRYPLKCRIKSVKIIIDDIVRFYAIPVRVGTTGYLYDKVSGELFANAGTGDFILGPDKYVYYDAQIEYLQSSGTQYIDTGIKVTSNPKAVVELMQTNTAGSDYWGNSFPGAYVNTDGMFSANFFYGGISWWRYGNNTHSCGAEWRVGLNVKFKIETGKKVILNDGEQEFEMSNDFVYSPDQKNIDIFRSRDTSYSSWKLYTFKLYDAGELVRDYIPVRVGQVGYLYDKVSGELFANAGTGNFILGPDKN